MNDQEADLLLACEAGDLQEVKELLEKREERGPAWMRLDRRYKVHKFMLRKRFLL